MSGPVAQCSEEVDWEALRAPPAPRTARAWDLANAERIARWRAEEAARGSTRPARGDDARAREEAARSERREALVEDVIALFALTFCVGGVAFGLGAVFSAGGCV